MAPTAPCPPPNAGNTIDALPVEEDFFRKAYGQIAAASAPSAATAEMF
jgi:hypothetical protein